MNPHRRNPRFPGALRPFPPRHTTQYDDDDDPYGFKSMRRGLSMHPNAGDPFGIRRPPPGIGHGSPPRRPQGDPRRRGPMAGPFDGPPGPHGRHRGRGGPGGMGGMHGMFDDGSGSDSDEGLFGGPPGFGMPPRGRRGPSGARPMHGMFGRGPLGFGPGGPMGTEGDFDDVSDMSDSDEDPFGHQVHLGRDVLVEVDLGVWEVGRRACVVEVDGAGLCRGGM
ncbi:hypothetical protein K458DRAFT_455411 [Lentithecium fluviatile CBS 122367]|uniref:Uncharacterized protein n=1 Tax=Lentithecium fluviatile CBS 122367 TaxID=1168545 RepID=A0A6G1JKV4_9PLEO|nr:hypothetical protein K458DRAFT_455411 [Lentithecium fluviatile CBS 122367]